MNHIKSFFLLVGLAVFVYACAPKQRESVVDRFLSVKMDFVCREASFDDVLTGIESELSALIGTNVVLFDDQTAMHSHDRWMTFPQQTIPLRDFLPILEAQFNIEVAIGTEKILLSPGSRSPAQLTPMPVSTLEEMFPDGEILTVIALAPHFRPNSGYTNSVVLPHGTAAKALQQLFSDFRLVHSDRYTEMLKSGTVEDSMECLIFRTAKGNTIELLGDFVAFPSLECYVPTRVDYRHPVKMYERTVELINKLLKNTGAP